MAVLAVADSDERHPRSLQAFPGLPASRPTLEPKPSAFCTIAPAHVHTGACQEAGARIRWVLEKM